MAIIFGVEIELHVEDDPDSHTMYETPYPVLTSHRRGQPQGNMHSRHGLMVEEIHNITDGEVRVGYDLTASFGDSVWEGWELSSSPLSFNDTLEAWRKVYRSRAKKYLNADPGIALRRYAPAHHSCGMHIHVSGNEITEDVIRTMSRQINSGDNREFVTHVAGRYNTQFCRVMNPSDEFLRCLFHSEGCDSHGKIDRGDISPIRPARRYCCYNATLLAEHVHEMELSRHTALNYLPNANTGAIELRLFSAPNEYSRVAANIEFADALIHYASENDGFSAEDFCAWLEEDRPRRRQYRHIFRHLRDAGLVRGLIPIR